MEAFLSFQYKTSKVFMEAARKQSYTNPSPKVLRP